MAMKMSILKDERTQSHSLLTLITVREYLAAVEAAYTDRGGIEGQRDSLKSTTARRIRERMVEDLGNGAVLPPIVIGLVLNNDTLKKVLDRPTENILNIIPEGVKSSLAIIDGMQRTTALFEASKLNKGIFDRKIRVEFWLSKSVHSLVYRMLVLNTGQVPWNLSRQLSVVYRSLLNEVSENVPAIEKIINEDDANRRYKPGEYKSSWLVELYLSFASRKTSIDTKQKVSEQFAKLDFIENLSREEFKFQFYDSLTLLANFDKAFSKYNPKEPTESRFKKGRNIFDSGPARVGFIVAMGKHIIGRAGSDRSTEEQEAKLESLKDNLSSVLKRINSMNEEQLSDFLRLETLSEVLLIKTGKVGDHERRLFEGAFKVLIEENISLSSLEACWRDS